jgi:hypothetical protein
MDARQHGMASASNTPESKAMNPFFALEVGAGAAVEVRAAVLARQFVHRSDLASGLKSGLHHDGRSNIMLTRKIPILN